MLYFSFISHQSMNCVTIHTAIIINITVIITITLIGNTMVVITQNTKASAPIMKNVARNQTIVNPITDKKNLPIFFMIFNHLPYGISL